MLKQIYILLFLSFLLLKGYSQSYNFKHYSVENGLPFIQIFSVFQDERGYLWTSGYGGLSRFDGKEFINYSPKSGLANHYVNAVTCCTKGNLWIGTKNGLNEFVNEKTFNTYTTKNGLPSNVILTLASDKKNSLYVGTDNGLCVLRNDKFEEFSSLKGQAIKTILNTNNLGIVIGTNNGVHILKDPNSKTTSTIISNVNANCLTVSGSTLWIGSENGLIKYDFISKKQVLFGVSNGLIDENITSLTSDLKGNLWIGTKTGLMKFNGKRFLYYKISSEANSNNILCSTIDYEENIWFGTHAGLFKFRDEGFISYGAHDGLNNTMVFPIARDNNQALWIGTESGGLFKYENNIFEQQKNTVHVGDTINCFLKENDKLWISSNYGLSVYRNKSFHLVKNLPAANTYRVTKDKQNNYWIGLVNGIIKCKINEQYNATEIEYFTFENTAADCQTWAIMEDNLGQIWAGVYMAGLYKLENNKFVRMNEKLGIKDADIFSIVKTRTGTLYAGSLDGVYQINPSTLQTFHFNEENGLSSNLVYTLLLTNNDNILWAGTNQGANKINLFDYNQTGTVNITHYGEADGFKGVECNTGSWVDEDGIIWFSTVSGLVRYNPEQYTLNDKEAKLSFTGLRLFYSDTTLPNNAMLSHDYNNISFNYSGICLTNPEKVKYIHKLEGFDKYWSPESNENLTRYSNLPPGAYTFKVRCSNNENIWNQPIEFSFTIEKPVYQRWWFILACIGFVVSIIILIFRIRLNQVQRKQAIETEQQIEISKNQLKALRSQMNPHFMFNSLNSIQNFILNNKDDRAVMYLNKFAKLMRLILNNSEKSHITLSEELEAIRLYIELEQMRFQNQFKIKIKLGDDIDPDYEQIPTMLIQPYVENAILHGLNPKKDAGLLQIDIRLAGSVMICSIIDNGIGRKKSAEMKRNSAKEHKSMAMDITKQRLQILNTMNQSNLSVRINDLKDEKGLPIGTKVDIFIPIT
jgi:ligand-binding sensor domain-containing protein